MPKRPELALKSGKSKGLKKSQVEAHKRTAAVWELAGKGDYYKSESYQDLVVAQKQHAVTKWHGAIFMQILRTLAGDLRIILKCMLKFGMTFQVA